MSIERREAERIELRRQAARLLAHPEEAEPRAALRRLRPVLRLWHAPSSGPHHSWTLFAPPPSPDEPPALLVRVLTWDQVGDMNRLIDPIEGLRHGFGTAPTLAVRDGRVLVASIAPLLDEGRGLRVAPLAGEELLALDGEGFGVEHTAGLHVARFVWWNDGPTEWQELTVWAERMRRFLDMCAG